MLRPALVFAAALGLAGGAGAQPAAPLAVSPAAPAGADVLAAQQILQIAPQLLSFAGSQANFQSLATGLTSGLPVTLATVTPQGTVQVVTFVPGAPLSALDAARSLETARTNLIAQGISSPSAQQIAGSLTGTPTVAGTPTVPMNAAGQPVVFSAPGGPLTGFELAQAQQLANQLLAQQGILNPTPEQLRVALLGGTLTTAVGTAVPVQGVLQGRQATLGGSPTPFTSASPAGLTSASPTPFTSASPLLRNTSDTPALNVPAGNPSAGFTPGIPGAAAGSRALAIPIAPSGARAAPVVPPAGAR